MLFSGATYPPPSRDPGYWGGPPMLFWAVRSSCGGEAGLRGVSPEISKSTGQKLCVPGVLGSSPALPFLLPCL